MSRLFRLTATLNVLQHNIMGQDRYKLTAAMSVEDYEWCVRYTRYYAFSIEDMVDDYEANAKNSATV